ncbi:MULTISPECIES: cytochrome c peroxidase [Leisingera]|jgi:cytochrome c peroxidase|uniref:Cytochrome C n=1 Tax=Leisingera caerulea TaxID=506591 RepID=A0A9Q9M017_LEICA|nr:MULTISPECIES: cytochrome c peroxidase [Leisingera]KIC31475.1 cytochrome C [Leisingera sp. ANG-S5]MCB4456492.1 cytochrome C [Leisingera sp. McT4-56]UWQ53152.1 cytochrome C [Leisingera caerulea]
MKNLISAALVGLLPVAAGATAIEQAPWAPRSAAYRLTLFMGNLTPVPWEKIENSWTAPAPGSALSEDAMSRVSPDEARAISAALASHDRQALFEAATAAVAQGILRHLAAAETALGQPYAAHEVANAEALFRAFEDGIKAADANAARDLGRAWLALNSSLGTAGVLGHGAQETDAESFAAARATLETYLTENYLPAAYAERETLTPVPESAVRSGTPVSLPATLPPGSNIADQQELPRLVLQFEEAGEDEANLPLVAYGDMLFDSPEIFGGPARELGIACSTCHNRSDVNRDFFIPGLSKYAGGMDVDGSFFNPMFNDRVDDHLDTPSMRGIRFTAPYGRDGREPSLRRFIRNVIVTEFAGDEPTPFQLDALEAYVKQFDFLPNPKIDRAGRLTNLASEAAKRGEKLFNTDFAGLGDRSCASCHTPERNFRDGLTYDIGTAEPPFPGGTPIHFETPTLRNINFTAPYMHDGSLPTLASVVDWFDESKVLGLDEAQRADLTAYLEAVGDGEEPYQAFEGRDSVFRLSWEELTTFASTLDTLLPMRDAENIALLVDTVAPDLAADASVMVNQNSKPEIYEFAAILRAVGDASAKGDWEEAGRQWDLFKAMQADIDERMF